MIIADDYCLLLVARCWLLVVCCWLFVACCWLFVFIGCCLLFDNFILSFYPSKVNRIIFLETIKNKAMIALFLIADIELICCCC